MTSHSFRRITLVTVTSAILVIVIGQTPAADPQSNKATDESPAFRQPDYELWQSIKKGMDETEVVQILGQPTAKPDPFDRKGNVLYSWEFGRVASQSVVFPHSLVFRVRFHRGKAQFMEDPFDGVFSKDGLPTIPKPAWPAQPPVYSHFPRLMDYRWNPSSGGYPMRYEVEVSNAQSVDADGAMVWRVDRVYKSAIPYASGDFVARGSGRWRVRATNQKGTSGWSNYCEFSFTR